MLQQMFGRLITKKTLIRVVFAILSLSGIAHAESTDRAGPQHGGNYNFMAGGGG